ncbi:hypothetical protein B0H14DRAFT_3526498 [Mycena olivaceomarginata]|nr:hypothetical protein B0H14DRAFT_3526498 [Mycena olivaceomarginata]
MPDLSALCLHPQHTLTSGPGPTSSPLPQIYCLRNATAPSPQYYVNVCLKINVKLSGIKTISNPSSVSVLTDPHNPTIVMGYSSGPGSDGCPSFTAVVANVDSDTAKYIAASRVQTSHVEMIEELEVMSHHCLTMYMRWSREGSRHHCAEAYDLLPDCAHARALSHHVQTATWNLSALPTVTLTANDNSLFRRRHPAATERLKVEQVMRTPLHRPHLHADASKLRFKKALSARAQLPLDALALATSWLQRLSPTPAPPRGIDPLDTAPTRAQLPNATLGRPGLDVPPTSHPHPTAVVDAHGRPVPAPLDSSTSMSRTPTRGRMYVWAGLNVPPTPNRCWRCPWTFRPPLYSSTFA